MSEFLCLRVSQHLIGAADQTLIRAQRRRRIQICSSGISITIDFFTEDKKRMSRKQSAEQAHRKWRRRNRELLNY